ncbi:hypothetical protein COCCU_09660 [Corynebacterium occultum]|uniref:Uncharacterized protein n=1 Tax=Corynebacterium occultum TaxID=2675219 RepID=A0A6B8WAJ8_9CORY|nr:hypothetical protein [Corynebacterium occultum]QGU07856.1 hypothetical protein COCCU_09660 [Corynebacterium occultum]
MRATDAPSRESPSLSRLCNSTLSTIIHAELRRIIDQALSDRDAGQITVDQIHDQLKHQLTLYADVDADPKNDLLTGDQRMQRHSWAEIPHAFGDWVSWISVTRRLAAKPAPPGVVDPADRRVWGEVLESVSRGLDQLLDVDLSRASNDRDTGHLQELEAFAKESEQMAQLARRQLRGHQG